MDTTTPFKWRHFQAEIILLCVRWYLRYPLSYRDLEEILLERGVHVDHTTISRWVQGYGPELEKRCRSHLKATNDSWRVDETYVKVKKAWMYLYRAVDSQGNTLEFLLSPTRDAQAAKRFFTKALTAPHTSTPRVITVDKNPTYPKAWKRVESRKDSARPLRIKAEEVPQQSGAARPSVHQTARQARDRFLFVQDRVANLARI